MSWTSNWIHYNNNNIILQWRQPRPQNFRVAIFDWLMNYHTQTPLLWTWLVSCGLMFGWPWLTWLHHNGKHTVLAWKKQIGCENGIPNFWCWVHLLVFSHKHWTQSIQENCPASYWIACQKERLLEQIEKVIMQSSDLTP